MAWTAGVGRSHFAHRAGVVFGDANELATRLNALAEYEDESDPLAPAEVTRVAIVYAGQGGEWKGMGEALYRAEPVARAVLDRCDRLVREERGASLLDVMFGRPGAVGDLGDPTWALPAVYALEAALTALWESVGVKPARVLGDGVGEIAAALAAGVLTLEDGLRLAMAVSNPAEPLPRMALDDPSVALVSSVTGRDVRSSDDLDDAHWRRLADAGSTFHSGVETLAGMGADLVVQVGPRGVQGSSSPQRVGQWIPMADNPRDSWMASFVPAKTVWPEAKTSSEPLPAAYDAGAPIAFAGLFSGEERRRIAIPGYPFQRRRFWVQPRGSTA